MFRHLGILLLLVLSFSISTWGQTPSTPVKPQEKTDEDDVVKITTNLVQVDVTVTDKEGGPVTDLKPEDFEIREEGQLQQITNLSFIGTSPATSATEPSRANNKAETRGKVSTFLLRLPERHSLSALRGQAANVQRSSSI